MHCDENIFFKTIQRASVDGLMITATYTGTEYPFPQKIWEEFLVCGFQTLIVLFIYLLFADFVNSLNLRRKHFF